jgi:hypothetical protein
MMQRCYHAAPSTDSRIMPWNTRAEYFRLAGASATPLADKLNELGFSAQAPARTIITTPTNLTPRFRDRAVQDATLLMELMHNFYAYGRGHWSWTGSSTGAAADGGLIKGAVNYCACGAFNDAFAYLATRVLGIEGVKKGNAPENLGKTWYKGSFITMPTDVIDSQWVGGVRSHNYSFAALKMFKFTDHYFCNYNGVIFDATADATHASTKTMVACDLEALPAAEALDFNGPMGQVFRIKNVSENFVAKPDLNLNVGTWIAIALGADTLSAGGANRAFNKYLITNQTKVGKSEIENFQLTSGRTSKMAYA